MTHTLYIGNDITTAEPVQIFCEEDFVRLVDERLGRDASSYISNIIEQRNDAIKERDEVLYEPDYNDGYIDGYNDGLAAVMREKNDEA